MDITVTYIPTHFIIVVNMNGIFSICHLYFLIVVMERVDEFHIFTVTKGDCVHR